MWVYLRIDKERIKDIKFKAFGCVAAIATSSMLTQLAKGKTLSEARKITDKDIVEGLEGLPPIKHHCSVLAGKALKLALDEYEAKVKAAPKNPAAKTKAARRKTGAKKKPSLKK
jgi:nitrogen fixation NifU-like protein